MAAAVAASGGSEDSDCPICMAPIAKQRAVVTRCCRHKFCANCIQGVQTTAAAQGGGANNRCPYCRGENFAFDQVATRQVRAPRLPQPRARPRSYHCLATGCRFSGSENDFLAHLVDRHRRDLLDNHHRLFSQEQQQHHPHHHHQHHQHQLQEEPQERDPQLAENGKTYCGGPLNGPPCECCNGTCGPQDGCNCVHCMTIDLANFQVTHGNSLVNKFGRVSSLSSSNGLFYCAGIMDLSDSGEINYCGPVDGPHCAACSALDGQCNGRYASLM